MLEPFAQLLQHCWDQVFFQWHTACPNIAGSCCIRLHTVANTNAATPNIVGPTMLFAVAAIADDNLSPFKACKNEIWAGEEFYWYADKAESEMDERSRHQNVAPVVSGCEAVCSRRNSSQATSNQKGCVDVRLLCAALFVVSICILFCNLVHSTSWQRMVFFFSMSWMRVKTETTLKADEVIFGKEISKSVKCLLKNHKRFGFISFFGARKNHCTVLWNNLTSVNRTDFCSYLNDTLRNDFVLKQPGSLLAILVLCRYCVGVGRGGGGWEGKGGALVQ